MDVLNFSTSVIFLGLSSFFFSALNDDDVLCCWWHITSLCVGWKTHVVILYNSIKCEGKEIYKDLFSGKKKVEKRKIDYVLCFMIQSKDKVLRIFPTFFSVFHDIFTSFIVSPSHFPSWLTMNCHLIKCKQCFGEKGKEKKCSDNVDKVKRRENFFHHFFPSIWTKHFFSSWKHHWKFQKLHRKVFFFASSKVFSIRQTRRKFIQHIKKSEQTGRDQNGKSTVGVLLMGLHK